MSGILRVNHNRFQSIAICQMYIKSFDYAQAYKNHVAFSGYNGLINIGNSVKLHCYSKTINLRNNERQLDDFQGVVSTIER